MKKIYIFGQAEKYQNYAEAVRFCGAEPFFSEDASKIDGCDGLLLTGGGDVDPAFFGQANQGSFMIDHEMDQREFAVIRAFAGTGKPILGICRGLQILNVAYGGALIQDLDTADTHRWEEGTGDKAHAILAPEDGFLFPLYGSRFPVNSAHHQGIGRLAEGFTVSARAEDGVIEAIEAPGKNMYAVQFHPERMAFNKRREDTVDGRKIFEFFLDLC